MYLCLQTDELYVAQLYRVCRIPAKTAGLSQLTHIPYKGFFFVVGREQPIVKVNQCQSILLVEEGSVPSLSK